MPARGPFLVRGLLMLSLGLLGMQSRPAYAARQTDYREVEPDELMRYPQNYWSLGVLFQDELTEHPTDDELRLGTKLYLPFRTRILGLCYADMALVPELRKLASRPAWRAGHVRARTTRLPNGHYRGRSHRTGPRRDAGPRRCTQYCCHRRRMQM